MHKGGGETRGYRIGALLTPQSIDELMQIECISLWPLPTFPCHHLQRICFIFNFVFCQVTKGHIADVYTAFLSRFYCV